MTQHDELIEAVKDLEDAVDRYAASVYLNVTNPDPEDVLPSVMKALAIDASVKVAQAMTDADVDLVDPSATMSVIPAELRGPMAAAEIAALRQLQARRPRSKTHAYDNFPS